jgi:EmrB/QacA subfamily drug resistance transporter
MNTRTAPEISAAGPASTPTEIRGALAALSLSMLLSSLGTSIANVSLPTLAQAFGAAFQAVQWIVLAYLLAVTALIVGAGRLGDIIGRRRLLLAGIVVFTTASLVCGFAGTLWLLIAARAAQGVGAAAMMALTLAFVGQIVPKDQMGRAMGLLGTTSAIGTALGPSLGGVLIAAFGWPAIFLVNLPLGLVAILLARNYLPRDRPAATKRGIRFDWLGTFLLALALAAYALAMTVGRGHWGKLNFALLAMAGISTGFFVLAEAKVPAPLLRLALLRDRGLAVGWATSALVATVMMTTLVVGPFYLSLALGLKSASVGMVLSVGPLVAAIMGIPAGRMADRLGAARVMNFGLAGITTGAIGLALLPAPNALVAYVLPMVVMTVSYAFFQAANNTAVMREVPADQRGLVSGMLNLARNLGLITGASVMGAVFAFAAQATDVTQAPPAAIATGMRATFAFAAVLMLVALAVAAGARADKGALPRLAKQAAA